MEGTRRLEDDAVGDEAAVSRDAEARIAELEEIVAGQRAELGLLRLQLEMLVATDVVTGLPNFTGLMQALEKQLARHHRTSEPFGVMLIEMDGLEEAERVGRRSLHDALRHGGAMISAALRESDTVGRIDERTFAAVLPDLDREGAAVVAGRIEANLRTMPIELPRSATAARPRVGVVLVDDRFDGDATTLMEILHSVRPGSGSDEPIIVDAGDLRP